MRTLQSLRARSMAGKRTHGRRLFMSKLLMCAFMEKNNPAKQTEVRPRWAIFERKHLPTMGNTTNNRPERFNRMFKDTLRERRRTVPSLGECIKVCMEVMNVKQNTTPYVKFTQQTRRLRVRHQCPVLQHYVSGTREHFQPGIEFRLQTIFKK